MNKTPYTDRLVAKLASTTLETATLEFQLQQAIREAIRSSVLTIAANIVQRELEEYGNEINEEFGISADSDPHESAKSIFQRVTKIATHKIESDMLNHKPDNSLQTSLGIKESNNPYKKYMAAGYQVLCD